MKALSGKEFARLLESHAWSLQRINGSHHIYAKADYAGEGEAMWRQRAVELALGLSSYNRCHQPFNSCRKRIPKC